MYYQLTCSCGKQHAVTVSQAGQSLSCSCGNPLSIPTLRGLKELPSTQAPNSAATRPIDRPSAARPSILTGLMFAIMLVAIPSALFFTYQRVTMDTSLTEVSDREEAEKMLDEAPVVAIAEAWDSYAVTTLGPPSKPMFYYVQRERQWLETKIMIAASVALVAAIIAGAAAAKRRLG